MNNIDSTQLAETINLLIKQNFKPFIALILIIFFSIIALIIILVTIVVKNIGKYKELNIGPLKLKNSDNNNSAIEKFSNDINNDSISINVFINILDMILSSQIKLVINNCIEASSKLESIYKSYDEYVNNKFNTILLKLKNDYYEVFINSISEIYNNDGIKIRNTKEYFFAFSSLNQFEVRWKQMSKEITRRNGFMDFKISSSNSNVYIQDIKNCIFSCIDIGKLNSETDFDFDVIKRELNIVNEKYNHELNVMFEDLATAKIKMFDKINKELDKIDNMVNDTVTNILNNILSKFLNTDKTVNEIRIKNYK